MLCVCWQGFAGKHYCPRMATMNKPAYQAIVTHSKEKPSLVFVSSRRQVHGVARDEKLLLPHFRLNVLRTVCVRVLPFLLIS
jgi:hypothetical protein